MDLMQSAMKKASKDIHRQTRFGMTSLGTRSHLFQLLWVLEKPHKHFGITYSRSSLKVIYRFCNFKQNSVYQNQFYYRLIDINKCHIPPAPYQCYNKTTLNKMTVFEALLYLIFKAERIAATLSPIVLLMLYQCCWWQ